jgi:PIN domain nuclease of toxin-antitoxin system
VRVLLDTQMLLWALIEPSRVPASASRILGDLAHAFLFSSVSILEIAIKYRLRRSDFDFEPSSVLRTALAAGFKELPVFSAAAARLADMPAHHRDPFDRLLVAQAIEHDALLLTADGVLASYGPSVLHCR